MNILVSGAGVAGLCLAIELGRRGFDVTVVETAPHLRKGGSPVDIRGRAVYTALRLGILEDAIAQRVTNGTMSFVDAEDRVLAELPSDTGTDGPDDVELPRDDLIQLLRAKVPSSVEILFSTRIVELAEHDDGVRVTLSDGSRHDFHLVLGADGLHSGVRRLAFGAESGFLKHLGLYAAIFSLDPSVVPPGTRRMYNEPGRMALIAHYGQRVLGGLLFASPIEYDHRDRKDQRAIVRDQFGGVKAWKVPLLLDSAERAADFYFDAVAQVHLPRWNRGRTALVGDAAHAATFLSGRGTSLAMMGAEFLAEELARVGGDHGRAFDAYEERLREYSDAAQDGVDEVRAFMVPATESELERRNDFYARLSRPGSEHWRPVR